MFHHRLYGRVVAAPYELPAPAVAVAPPDIIITQSSTPHSVDSSNAEFSYSQDADGTVTVSWTKLASFEISANGRQIAAYAARPERAESTLSYLLSQAISIALLKQGVEALHGVALEKDGIAVAIIGDCGYGKSTLAAHALMRGARLLTDDLLVIENGMVQPGAARIKLEPAIAARTLGPRAGVPMNDERGKWIYALEPGEFHQNPIRLNAVYSLKPDRDRLAVNRLATADAMKELLGATFDPLARDTSRLARHLRVHADLARCVPVYSAQMQKGLEHVDAALEALLR